MASITCTPASPTHALDAAIVAVTGLQSNDATAYDAAKYPTEPALSYHLAFVAPTAPDNLVGPVWSPDANGDYTALPMLFPVAGAWTVNCIDNKGDTIATASVTVA